MMKMSAIDATTFPAASYRAWFAGSARASVVLWDCIYDTYVAGVQSNWNTFSGVKYNIWPKLNTNDINQAMAFAAYTASIYNFGFLGQLWIDYSNNALAAQGYDISLVNNNDTSKPSGLGVLACQNVIKNFYDKDGSNYKGQDPNSDPPGRHYSDYTNWRTVNDPMPTPGHTDCSTIRFLDSWQPARARIVPGPGTQVFFWSDGTIANMKSVVMPCHNSFRPGPMPKNVTGTQAAWLKRNQILVDRSASLGDFEKTIAQYYQDGEGFSGSTWTRYAASAADKSELDLKHTVQLNMLIAHAQMEGYIVQYEGKRFYNGARPTSPIQCINKGSQIQAWKGPYKGVGTINGEDWSAFLPDNFVQNPTPEYPCGHCTHSGSVGAAFKDFFCGDDTFIGYSRTQKAGTNALEPKMVAGDPINPYTGYGPVPGVTDVPNTGPGTPGYSPAQDVTLNWNTWTELTSQAALSRTYLGVHYDDSQQVSYANGRNLGDFTFNWVKTNLWNNDFDSEQCGGGDNHHGGHRR